MLNINNNLVSSFYTRNNKHVKKHIVRTLRRSPLTIYINWCLARILSKLLEESTQDRLRSNRSKATTPAQWPPR
jgi:diketogulonate reductase-like aldo/keto reductase